MFGERTRCIVGDVQMANGIQSRLWVLDVIVGVKEKGVISKGTGKCPASSFATVVNNLKWHLEHVNFTSFITPATPIFEKQYKPFLMSVGLKLRLSLSVISTNKAQSLGLYCLPLLYPEITLTYSFLPKSSYFSKESAKFGAFKKRLRKKNNL